MKILCRRAKLGMNFSLSTLAPVIVTKPLLDKNLNFNHLAYCMERGRGQQGRKTRAADVSEWLGG